jgi:16S rRNA (cytidine1402-2'-O)-methyltransferase
VALYICASPIGNLDDVSQRLLDTLRNVVLVCAEDTRHTARLLARFEIQVALTSCHQHTSPSKIETLVQRLEEGEDMALLTDAGTPGVCDPGPALVTAAAKSGIEILPIPGPCALTAALSISGFDAQRFSFLGFLPRKDGKRRKVLLEAIEREETFCLYESPFRVIATLKSIAEVAPENQLMVCRELTKKFEETLRGKPTEVLEILQSRPSIKGEFVIVVSNPSVKKHVSED